MSENDSSTTYCLKPEIYQFRDALERLGGVAAISRSGEFTAVADGFSDLFGYSEEEVVGKPLSLLHYSSTMPALYKSMWSTINSGEAWMGELPCRHKGGEHLMVRVSIAPSMAATGGIAGFIAQYQRTDVPRHTELSEVFYRYRAGFNRLAALVVVSRQGEIQESNDLFTELYGYTRDEVMGRHIRILRSDETPRHVFQDIWTTILSGKIWTGEIKNRCKDGTLIHVRSTIAPAIDHLKDDDSTLDAFLVIYQDIELEVESREAKLKLAIESSRQEMLAATLHNIGNLQQSVMSASETAVTQLEGLLKVLEPALNRLRALDNELLVSARAGAVNTDSAQAERDAFVTGFWKILDTQINIVLDSERSGRKALETTVAVLHSFRQQQKNVRSVDEMNLQTFFNQIINTFSLQSSRNNISVSISEMLDDARVRWPSDRVQQIVFNLLKNAKEAIVERITFGHAKNGRIDISAVEEGEDVVIRIRDTGGGFKVPEEKRFSHGITTKTNGTGIGLHNSSIMAKSMSGSLNAENVTFCEQPGALLTLRLPRLIGALNTPEKTL